MNRMLEALKRIEAESPQTGRGIKPVSPEELDSFGLRPSPGPQLDEPGQAVVPVEAASENARRVIGGEKGQRDEEVTGRGADGVTGRGADGVMGQETPLQCASPTHPLTLSPSHPVTLSPTDPPTSPPPRAEEPDREVGRLLSPLAEQHKEQYGDLADRILAQLSSPRSAVLLFTSAGDGEGKTSTLASLSVALAEKVSGEIVAVDANFRSPALANHFGIWADEGLVDVLSGGRNWRHVVRKTNVKRLSVLPGGRFPTDDGSPPADLKLAPVLDALRLRYRLVLVDTASLSYPEVAPLSRLCEGTYLVAELGHTPRRAACRAVRLIEQCGGRVLGCVLSGVPVE